MMYKSLVRTILLLSLAANFSLLDAASNKQPNRKTPHAKMAQKRAQRPGMVQRSGSHNVVKHGPAINPADWEKKRAQFKADIDAREVARTSPINIGTFDTGTPDNVAFNYPASVNMHFSMMRGTLIGRLHKSDANKARVTINGNNYALQYIQIKVPAEHTRGYERSVAEIQLTHKDAAKKYVVYSVLVQDGEASTPGIGTLVHALKDCRDNGFKDMALTGGHRDHDGKPGKEHKMPHDKNRDGKKRSMGKNAVGRRNREGNKNPHSGYKHGKREHGRRDEIGKIAVALASILPTSENCARYDGTLPGKKTPTVAQWRIIENQSKIGAEDVNTLFRIMRLGTRGPRPLGTRKVVLEK